MHFSRFQLRNYKSFVDSGPLKFGPGFNLLVGPNDVGKSALLEAMKLEIGHAPHRSTNVRATGQSTAEFSFVVGGNELRAIVAESTGELRVYAGALPADASAALRLFVAQDHVEVSRRYVAGHDPMPSSAPGSVLRYGRFQRASPAEEHRFHSELHYQGGPPNDDILAYLAAVFRGGLFRFNPERFRIARAQFGTNSVLGADAANLPTVLCDLQLRQPARFNRFVGMLRRVFPHIKDVTVPGSGSGVEIRLWPVEVSTEREDLTVSLADSGTGVGQVMAMLTVLVTSDMPRVLLIDEPNTFLHPGALRVLTEILSEQSRERGHQYVIATHSPEMVAWCEPYAVHLVDKAKDGSAQVRQVDAANAAGAKAILAAVGARLSDVFVADKVLWVEGKTEELCFPLIVQGLIKRPLGRTAIVGVVQTGDFESDDAVRVAEIYRRLSRAGALVPPALAFIFDREHRNAQKRDELNTACQGKAHFLSRYCYENYLLHTGAIAAVLGKPHQDIDDWLAANRNHAKYYRGCARTPPDPINDVNAARLLDDLFAALTSHTSRYEKVTHGPRLTEWLIANAPEHLEEVRAILFPHFATEADHLNGQG